MYPGKKKHAKGEDSFFVLAASTSNIGLFPFAQFYSWLFDYLIVYREIYEKLNFSQYYITLFCEFYVL